MIPASAPMIQDQGEDESLIKAIENSIQYLENSDPTSLVKFGKVSYTVQTLKESLLDFKERLKKTGLNKRFFQYVENNYHFYKSAASEVLFTGYFEAHLNGSRQKSKDRC